MIFSESVNLPFFFCTKSQIGFRQKKGKSVKPLDGIQPVRKKERYY